MRIRGVSRLRPPTVSRTSMWVGLVSILAGAFAGYLLGAGATDSKTTAGILGGIALGWFGVITAAVWEVRELLTRPEPGYARIIRGQKNLTEEYERMREKPGARRIKAIWCINYPNVDIDDYFNKEFRYLEKRGDLTYVRLVNRDTVRPEDYESYRRSLQEFLTRNPSAARRYEWYLTDVRDFEAFICVYEQAGTDYRDALFVFCDPGTGVSPLGLRLDPERGPEASSAAGSVDDWFDRLARSVPAEPEATE